MFDQPSHSVKLVVAREDQGFFGASNSASMGLDIFFDDNEYRKAGHNMVGALVVSFKELRRSGGEFKPDRFKMWIAGEELVHRSNYGQNVEASFRGIKRKVSGNWGQFSRASRVNNISLCCQRCDRKHCTRIMIT